MTERAIHDYAEYLTSHPVLDSPADDSRWQTQVTVEYLRHELQVVRFPSMPLEVGDEVYFVQYGSKHRGTVTSVGDDRVAVSVWAGYTAQPRRDTVYKIAGEKW